MLNVRRQLLTAVLSHNTNDPNPVVLSIGGIDGNNNALQNSTLNYILLSDHRCHNVESVTKEISTEDSCIFISRDEMTYIDSSLNADMVAESSVGTSVGGIIKHVLTSSERDSDGEVADLFKVLQFVEAVTKHSNSKFYIPITENGSYSSEDGKMANDMMEVEKWPLIQSFALQDVGPGGFFSMNFKPNDCGDVVSSLLKHVDAHVYKYLTTIGVEFLNSVWGALESTILSTRRISDRGSILTYSNLIEPVWSFFQHSNLRRESLGHLICGTDSGSTFSTPSSGDVHNPFSLLGFDTSFLTKSPDSIPAIPEYRKKLSLENLLAEGEPPFFVSETVDGSTGIRCCRTVFLTTGRMEEIVSLLDLDREVANAVVASSAGSAANARRMYECLTSCYRKNLSSVVDIISSSGDSEAELREAISSLLSRELATDYGIADADISTFITYSDATGGDSIPSRSTLTAASKLVPGGRVKGLNRRVMFVRCVLALSVGSADRRAAVAFGDSLIVVPSNSVTSGAEVPVSSSKEGKGAFLSPNLLLCPQQSIPTNGSLSGNLIRVLSATVPPVLAYPVLGTDAILLDMLQSEVESSAVRELHPELSANHVGKRSRDCLDGDVSDAESHSTEVEEPKEFQVKDYGFRRVFSRRVQSSGVPISDIIDTQLLQESARSAILDEDSDEAADSKEDEVDQQLIEGLADVGIDSSNPNIVLDANSPSQQQEQSNQPTTQEATDPAVGGGAPKRRGLIASVRARLAASVEKPERIGPEDMVPLPDSPSLMANTLTSFDSRKEEPVVSWGTFRGAMRRLVTALGDPLNLHASGGSTHLSRNRLNDVQMLYVPPSAVKNSEIDPAAPVRGTTGSLYLFTNGCVFISAATGPILISLDDVDKAGSSLGMKVCRAETGLDEARRNLVASSFGVDSSSRSAENSQNGEQVNFSVPSDTVIDPRSFQPEFYKGLEHLVVSRGPADMRPSGVAFSTSSSSGSDTSRLVVNSSSGSTQQVHKSTEKGVHADMAVDLVAMGLEQQQQQQPTLVLHLRHKRRSSSSSNNKEELPSSFDVPGGLFAFQCSDSARTSTLLAAVESWRERLATTSMEHEPEVGENEVDCSFWLRRFCGIQLLLQQNVEDALFASSLMAEDLQWALRLQRLVCSSPLPRPGKPYEVSLGNSSLGVQDSTATDCVLQALFAPSGGSDTQLLRPTLQKLSDFRGALFCCFVAPGLSSIEFCRALRLSASELPPQHPLHSLLVIEPQDYLFGPGLEGNNIWHGVTGAYRRAIQGDGSPVVLVAPPGESPYSFVPRLLLGLQQLKSAAKTDLDNLQFCGSILVVSPLAVPTDARGVVCPEASALLRAGWVDSVIACPAACGVPIPPSSILSSSGTGTVSAEMMLSEMLRANKAVLQHRWSGVVLGLELPKRRKSNDLSEKELEQLQNDCSLPLAAAALQPLLASTAAAFASSRQRQLRALYAPSIASLVSSYGSSSVHLHSFIRGDALLDSTVQVFGLPGTYGGATLSAEEFRILPRALHRLSVSASLPGGAAVRTVRLPLPFALDPARLCSVLARLLSRPISRASSPPFFSVQVERNKTFGSVENVEPPGLPVRVNWRKNSAPVPAGQTEPVNFASLFSELDGGVSTGIISGDSSSEEEDLFDAADGIFFACGVSARGLVLCADMDAPEAPSSLLSSREPLILNAHFAAPLSLMLQQPEQYLTRATADSSYLRQRPAVKQALQTCAPFLVLQLPSTLCSPLLLRAFLREIVSQVRFAPSSTRRLPMRLPSFSSNGSDNLLNYEIQDVQATPAEIALVSRAHANYNLPPGYSHDGYGLFSDASGAVVHSKVHPRIRELLHAHARAHDQLASMWNALTEAAAKARRRESLLAGDPLLYPSPTESQGTELENGAAAAEVPRRLWRASSFIWPVLDDEDSIEKAQQTLGEVPNPLSEYICLVSPSQPRVFFRGVGPKQRVFRQMNGEFGLHFADSDMDSEFIQMQSEENTLFCVLLPQLPPQTDAPWWHHMARMKEYFKSLRASVSAFQINV